MSTSRATNRKGKGKRKAKGKAKGKPAAEIKAAAMESHPFIQTPSGEIFAKGKSKNADLSGTRTLFTKDQSKVNEAKAALEKNLDELISTTNALKLAARVEEKAVLANFTDCKNSLAGLLDKASALIANAESLKEDKDVNVSFIAAQKTVSEFKSLLETKHDTLPLSDEANRETILVRVSVLKGLVADINSKKRELDPILDSLDHAIKKSLIPMADLEEVVKKYQSTSRILSMVWGGDRSTAIAELRALINPSPSPDSKSSPRSDIKKVDILAALNKDKTAITLTLNASSASVSRSSLFERAIEEDIKPENVSNDTDKVIVRVAQIFKARLRA